MKRKLKIYLPFVNAGMQEVATYRVNWIFFMLGEALSCFSCSAKRSPAL